MILVPAADQTSIQLPTAFFRATTPCMFVHYKTKHIYMYLLIEPSQKYHQLLMQSSLHALLLIIEANNYDKKVANLSGFIQIQVDLSSKFNDNLSVLTTTVFISLTLPLLAYLLTVIIFKTTALSII